MTMKRLFDLKEAAEYLGMTVRNLRRYKKNGKLPFVQYSPTGKIQFKRETLDRFIDDHEKEKKQFDIKEFKPSKPKVSMIVHEREKAELAIKLGLTTSG